MRAHDDPEAAAVFEFLDDYLADLEAGRVRTLAEYLARHTGHDAAIAREYLALVAGAIEHDTPSATASGAGPARGDVDERRLGPYRLLRELGRGGQGSVWLAEDVRLARRVAVKVLASRFETVSEDRRKRFRREAEVIARLEHPGICPIFDADIDGETPWIAMRFIEGRTLAQVLGEARQAQENGTAPAAADDSRDSDVTSSWPPRSTLDVQRTLLFAERTARALHAAHEAGVIHRDVKPGNLIVTPDGKPVVLDFGLAREVESQADITESGEVFGTPAYMSPEQLRGSSQDLDRRTDVYSLGVALYEALTLKRPFEARGKKSALQAALQQEPLADPRALNPLLSYDVKVVLETALEQDRARRYPTALEFAEDLRRIREYEPIKARPASLGLRFARWTRRHPALAVSTIGTIVALAAGLTATSLLNVELEEKIEWALGKHLAQRSAVLVRSDPPCALELGIQAVELAPNVQSRQALLDALEASHLKFLLDTERADLVQAQALSPDGGELALACGDGTVHLFDAHSGARRATLGAKDLHSAVLCVLWSADGQSVWLATSDEKPDAGADARPARLERWERFPARRAAETTLPGRPAALLPGPGATLLLVRTQDGRLAAHDPRTLELRREFALPAGTSAHTPANAAESAVADFVVALDTAGRVVGARRARSELVLWDSGAAARVLPTPAAVTALSTASRAGHFALGLQGGLVELRDDEGARLATVEVWPAATIEHVALHESGAPGAVLAQAAGLRRAFLLDFDAPRARAIELPAAAAPRALTLAPDGRQLALACSDFALRIVATTPGPDEVQVARTIAVGFSLLDGIQWSLDGSTLFTRPRGGQVAHAWHAGPPPDLPRVDCGPGAVEALLLGDEPTLHVAAGRDGAALAPEAAVRWHGQGTAQLLGFGAAGWAELERAPSAEDAAQIRVDSPGGPPWSFECAGAAARAVLAPDGDALALIDEAGRTSVCWRNHSDVVRWELDPTVAVAEAAFDAAGERVACGARDGSIHVRSVRGQETLAVLTVPQPEFDQMAKADGTSERRSVPAADARKPVAHLAFRPGSDELASFHEDMRVRLWDVRTGQLVHTFSVLFPPRSLEFSRDGALLLASGRVGGGAVRVFDAATRRPYVYLTHHARDLTAAEFSSDGRFVLTASRDGTIYVRYSRPVDEPLFARRVFPGLEVVSAHFDPRPGELRVVSVTNDGEVRVWPVDPLPAAHRRFRYELSAWEVDRERKEAFPIEYLPRPAF